MPPAPRPRVRDQRCMFLLEPDSPPCLNAGTYAMPGFLPELYVCAKHARTLDHLIDLAT